jgi:hypothetical protein
MNLTAETREAIDTAVKATVALRDFVAEAVEDAGLDMALMTHLMRERDLAIIDAVRSYRVNEGRESEERITGLLDRIRDRALNI